MAIAGPALVQNEPHEPAAFPSSGVKYINILQGEGTEAPLLSGDSSFFSPSIAISLSILVLQKYF